MRTFGQEADKDRFRRPCSRGSRRLRSMLVCFRLETERGAAVRKELVVRMRVVARSSEGQRTEESAPTGRGGTPSSWSFGLHARL